MDAKITTRQNTNMQIEQGLRNERYHLDGRSGTYLLDNRNMVVCILDGKITSMKNTLNNVRSAQQLFRDLTPGLQQLARRTVTASHNTKPMVNPTARAAPSQTQRAQTPSTGKTTELPRSTQTHITPLTNKHCKNLQILIKRGEVFFNDDLKALTSMDQGVYFSPNDEGRFTTSHARAGLPDYKEIKSHYDRWEKTPEAMAQTSGPQPSFTAEVPQQDYSTTSASKDNPDTFSGIRTSEQLNRDKVRHTRSTATTKATPKSMQQPAAQQSRPTLKAVASSLPPSPKTIVKAMNPMPHHHTSQAEVAKMGQQQSVVIRHYFSGYKDSYDNFKKEYKELCDFMREKDILGKAKHRDHYKSIFEHRGLFEHHLYQMFMIETSRAALSPLIERFRSADTTPQTKTDLAIEIAEQCIQRDIDTSDHLLDNKTSYDKAYSSTETKKDDSPLTVAVADTPAVKFFIDAIHIFKNHQTDAAKVRRFLEQNYDTPDFAFEFDIKKAESDGRYRREGGPAEAKKKLLSRFQALIKSGEVIDIESGSLTVPAVVAANSQDMACYETYAQQMFSLQKKVEASLETQDSASFQDANFLLNICQAALQTMELNDKCAKKQLASQAAKPALY